MRWWFNLRMGSRTNSNPANGTIWNTDPFAGGSFLLTSGKYLFSACFSANFVIDLNLRYPSITQRISRYTSPPVHPSLAHTSPSSLSSYHNDPHMASPWTPQAHLDVLPTAPLYNPDHHRARRYDELQNAFTKVDRLNTSNMHVLLRNCWKQGNSGSLRSCPETHFFFFSS